MRRSSVRLAATVAVVCAVLAAPVALAQEGDSFTGTYSGSATTMSGRTVPITVYLVDNGGTVDITIEAEGYSASTTGQVSRNGEAATIQASVNTPGVISGSGSATLAKEGDAWKATGSGNGTALAKYTGTADGAVQRVAADFSGAPASGAVTVAAVKSADPALRPLGPTAPQPPISDTERVLAGAAGLIFSLLVLLTALVTGAPKWLGAATQWL